MIPRLHKRGGRTLGLLHYLYGPGTHEEHLDPHLVAAWDPFAPDPGRDQSATLKELQRLLDQPVAALGKQRRPDKHVWHLSVRAAPEDPRLSDGQWADIARRMVQAAGIAPEGDDAGCRWAAVRHADDHIHIVATLVRDDGRRPRLYNDARRVQDEARRLEADYGLRRLSPGDGTAARRPTSAERHKAQRHRRDQTPREELRETVRRAVAGAASEKEFFDRLTSAGLLVRQRTAPSGDLLGYTVALPDDRNRDGAPVFYSGSKLAPDLSLPRLRARFDGDEPRGPHEKKPQRSSPTPAEAHRTADLAARNAVQTLADGDDSSTAAHLAAAGEVLDALAKNSSAPGRRELREAARAFERASRSHVRAEHVHARALRQAARDLIYAGPALGHGRDGAGTAMLLDTLYFLTVAAVEWHQRHHHAQQAAAAQATAHHLRTAYRDVSAAPLGALREKGRRLLPHAREQQAAVVRAALPETVAHSVLSEPGWHALAATLSDLAHQGHEPRSLLAKVVAERELTSAESVSEVLTWRLRRAADLRTEPSRSNPPAPSLERARAAERQRDRKRGRRR